MMFQTVTATARITPRHHPQGDAGDHHGQHDHERHRTEQRHQRAADPRQHAHRTPRARHHRRHRDRLCAAALAVLCAFPALARPDIGDIFTGPARIIDGDTLEIGGQSIRLFGIDTPERGSPGFAVATDYLRDLTADADLTCATVDVDRYARAVGLCRIGPPDRISDSQETLSEAMLRSCLARRLSFWNHRVPPAMRDRLDRATCR
jgi:endonuclease YncB( thermonuclease family)